MFSLVWYGMVRYDMVRYGMGIQEMPGVLCYETLVVSSKCAEWLGQGKGRFDCLKAATSVFFV